MKSHASGASTLAHLGARQCVRHASALITTIELAVYSASDIVGDLP
jgi:hypothetical protein